MSVNAIVTGRALEQIPAIPEILGELVEGRDFFRLPTLEEGTVQANILLTHVGLQVLTQRLGILLTGGLDGASLTGGSAPAYGGGDLSSVTLVRNAKGGVQPEVKVYAAEPAEAQQRAVAIFDALATKYPHVNAGSPAKGE